jgi:phage terminase large subunit-like protein
VNSPFLSNSPLLEAKLHQLEELRKLKEELDFLSTIPNQINREYAPTARPAQYPPDDPRHLCSTCEDAEGIDPLWNIWLLLAGRGFGKTFVGASWTVHNALAIPNSEWLVTAPTFRDVQRTCFEGDSGILKRFNEGEMKQYLRNELLIKLSNGSKIHGVSADEPERARGMNLWGAWADEIGSWRRPEIWYEGIIPAIRKGEHPRVVVTTTPRPTALIKDLYSRRDGTVHLTRGSTFDNQQHLSAIALAELKRRYDGTRLGQQELYGALLEDIEGALFRRDLIDNARITRDEVPADLVQLVVAVDPAVTSDETSDLTGIVVVGCDEKGHGYVLADRSMKGTPDQCMREAARTYHEFHADTIVAEVNNGGDYIGSVLKHVDPFVPIKVVRASRGKEIRAEPTAALYEQGRIHHVGMFANLEDEMCDWIPGVTKKSPDRVDALVWAVSGLNGLSGGGWASAYGVVYCDACEKPFVLKINPETCPKCSAPHRYEAA